MSSDTAAMSSDTTASEAFFASGRYSKRKRTQITYSLSELDVSDSESDFEKPQSKKNKATSVSRPLPKRKIFPFLELPAEIRNMIYGYALTEPSGINLIGTFKHKRRTVERVSAETQDEVSGSRYWLAGRMNDEIRAKNDEPVPLASALLAVNKQIHQEAGDFLYGNEIVFADTFALYAFLINIGPLRAKSLREIRLLNWGYGRALKAYNHACFAVLSWATNITTFHVDAAKKSWPNNPKTCAEQLYRDGFPFLEAIERERGSRQAAIDVFKLDDDQFVTRTWINGIQVVVEDKDRGYGLFKTQLAKFMGAHQESLMALPVRKAKKRKLSREEL